MGGVSQGAAGVAGQRRRCDLAVRLAQSLVGIFAERLPESRATVARARDTNDLVRLVASKQLEVALLRESQAHAVLTGAEPFSDNGRVELRTLAALGDHLLVCLDGVSTGVAYKLVEALADGWRDAGPIAGARRPGPPAGARGARAVASRRVEFYRDHG